MYGFETIRSKELEFNVISIIKYQLIIINIIIKVFGLTITAAI